MVCDRFLRPICPTARDDIFLLENKLLDLFAVGTDGELTSCFCTKPTPEENPVNIFFLLYYIALSIFFNFSFKSR